MHKAHVRVARLVLRIGLSVGISALFIWLSLRNTDLRAVGKVIAGADPARLAGYVLVFLVIHVVRTVRWGILLEPFGHVPFRRLNAASAVGFMLLMVLPLRLGEFGRPFAIAQQPPGGVRIRRSGAMASCVVERIVDGVFVGLVGMLGLRLSGSLIVGDWAGFARKASILVAVGFGVLGVVMALTIFQHERALRLTHRLLDPISPKLAQRAVGMMDAFLGAVHLGSGWKTLAFFALTAVYWGLNAVGLMVLAPAFGIHFTPLMAASILAVQVVGVMVPAGPGMVGTMQLFTAVGVSLYYPLAMKPGPLSAQVAGYANLIWLLQFVTQVGLGCLFLAVSHITVRGLLSFNSGDAANEGDGLGPPAAAASDAA